MKNNLKINVDKNQQSCYIVTMSGNQTIKTIRAGRKLEGNLSSLATPFVSSGLRVEGGMSWKNNFLIVSFFVILYSLICFYALPAEIDLERIKQIESSGNPLAYNKSSHARGLYQITPICLVEYNNFHDGQYFVDDLFNPEINEKIADWYLHKRIPQMLRHFNKPVTVDNILIAYNSGISYVVSGKTLPNETIVYLKKYKESGK
jgi:hypothetical protein